MVVISQHGVDTVGRGEILETVGSVLDVAKSLMDKIACDDDRIRAFALSRRDDMFQIFGW